MEDRISKDGKRAKCRLCGYWYGIDESHGMNTPRHLGAMLGLALDRQVAASDGLPTDVQAAYEFIVSVERGASFLEDRKARKEDAR